MKEKELNRDSVVKEFLTTAVDGKSYNVVFYSLEIIIAVGNQIRGLHTTFLLFPSFYLDTSIILCIFALGSERNLDTYL